MAPLDFSKEFILERDACNTGIGAMLSQEGRPVAYLSQTLAPRHMGLSIYDKELLVVLMTVEKWRYYLEGNKFTIKTDHECLKFLSQQRVHNQLQRKGITKLMGFDFIILYRKGKENIAADALSRRDVPTSCQAISALVPNWVQDITHSYDQTPCIKDLLTKISVQATADPNYQLKGGLLRFQNRVVIGNDEQLKKKILQSLHDSPIRGIPNSM